MFMTYKPGTFLNLFVNDMNSYEVTLEDNEQNQFFMPASEQTHKLSVGNEIMTVLFMGEDPNGKRDLLASMRLEKHANADLKGLKPGQQVDLFIINETPLGYKCIVDGAKIGMLYKNEVFTPLQTGQHTKGFISKLREDNKIDLLLRAPGHHATQDIGEKIIEQLKKAGGFLAINDKTSPEKIYEIFGASKKKYKVALGGLYKQRLISVSDEGITLVR